MKIYCAGTTCTNYIFADKNKKFKVEKNHNGTLKELEDWVKKWEAKNPEIKGRNAALGAYSAKYAQEDRSAPIAEFMDNFYEVFPDAVGRFIVLVIDKETWQIAKGKESPKEGLKNFIKAKFKETPGYCFH